MDQLAQLAASSVGQVIEGERQLLVAMSRLPAVITHDDDACSIVMVDLQQQYDHYANLGAIGPDGKIFCTALPQALSTDVSDRTYFQRAVAGQDFAIGDYQIGRLSGVAVVVAAYPVYAGDRLQAVVFASLDLTNLGNIIAAVGLPTGATVTVIDQNSTILARNPDHAQWVGQVLPDAPVIQAAQTNAGQTQMLVGVDGISRLYGFSDVAVAGPPEADLRVAVGLPTEVAFASLQAALRRDLLTLGVVTIIALTAAWLGGNAFVLRPMRQLVDFTRELAAGNLAARVGEPYGEGEVGRLAEVFDGMAEGLSQRAAQLTRVNGMLKMLSECNQALVRATTEPQLLGDVCRNMVEFGGYTPAWVRLTAAPADAPPAAWAGADAVAALEAAATQQDPTPLRAPLAVFWSDLTMPGQARPVTLAAIPLQLRGETLGRLYLATAQPAGFNLDEIQLLDELAGDLAFGLTAMRGHTARELAEAQVQAGADRALAIANIGRDLAAVTTNYRAGLEMLVRRVAELVGDGALVTLLDDAGEWLHTQASYHAIPAHDQMARQLLGSQPISVKAEVTAQVLATGQPVVVAGPPPERIKAAIAPEFWPYLDQFTPHTILVVPLRAQGRILGTLALWRDVNPHPFSQADQDFLLDLADRSALAIANARLYAAAQDQNAVLEARVAARTRELSSSNQALEGENAERRRAEAALQQVADEFQDLYDHAPCGYHSLDPDGVFVRINAYELKLLGYTQDEVIGRMRLAEVLTPDSQALFSRSYPRFIEQGWVNNLEYEVVGRDGHTTAVLVSATALRDADGRYVMSRSTMVDITARKQAEGQIETLNANLRQRATALEAANRELEAFSYSVSHDLRAPLRSIDGFSLALLEDYGPQLAPDARDYLTRVRSAAQRMATLIDDLLNLSRVSRTEMRWEVVDLSALAQSVAGELQQAQPERAATFTIEPGLTATGDGRLLRLALDNLFNNAWKFTSKQPAAVIEFGTLPHESGRAYFVRDNGAGFDMAYAQRLFGAFQRLHDQQEYAGTGIGLATVQRIVNRHSGRVWAEGQVGAGATIYFTLADNTPPADA